MELRHPEYSREIVNFLGAGKIDSIHAYADAEAEGEMINLISPTETRMFELKLFDVVVPIGPEPHELTVADLSKALLEVLVTHHRPHVRRRAVEAKVKAWKKLKADKAKQKPTS